jgi:cysteine desulfurase
VPEDVIFTSGSTEANNLVLNTGRTVITSATEHPSVLDAVKRKLTAGDAHIVGVDEFGKVRMDEIVGWMKQSEKALLSIMMVNNEVGVVQDVRALAESAHTAGGLFHTDATQATVTLAIEMKKASIDALSLSAHKLYGPKGVGALVCNAAIRKELRSTQFGGGHERGFRSGTLNVPGIVGFGAAARIAVRERRCRLQSVHKVRDEFRSSLTSSFRGRLRFFESDSISPHITSVQLEGVSNRALLKATSAELCFSLGSACATNKSEPSHVLVALGRSKRDANETIRVSFGDMLGVDDVRKAAQLIADAGNKLLELVA